MSPTTLHSPASTFYIECSLPVGQTIPAYRTSRNIRKSPWYKRILGL